MGFIDIRDVRPISLVPGCRMVRPMANISCCRYWKWDTGAEVPLHSHPHEQGGILLEGKLQLTIGDETRVVEPGAMYIIPPHVLHRAVAIDGPTKVLDVFSPVREDYAELTNRYIPPVGSR